MKLLNGFFNYKTNKFSIQHKEASVYESTSLNIYYIGTVELNGDILTPK